MHNHVAFRCRMIVFCGGFLAVSGMLETPAARAGFIVQTVPGIDDQPCSAVFETALKQPAETTADNQTGSAADESPASETSTLGTAGSVGATGHSSDLNDETHANVPQQHRRKKGPPNGLPYNGSGGTSLGGGAGGAGSNSASAGGGPALGNSLASALLPINGIDGNVPYPFQYNIVPGGPGNGSMLFVDPTVAIGYNFDILSGPLFESVQIPSDIPIPGQSAQDSFNLNSNNLSFQLDAGEQFFFTQDFASGTSHFSINGIDAAAGLDPNTPYDVALTFVGTGDSSFTMTPISQNPEPGTLTLLGLGGIGLFAWKWRRSRRNSVPVV